MAATTPKQMFVAITSGAVRVGDDDITIHKGSTLVEEGHEVLDAVPDWFQPVSTTLGSSETTTDTPSGPTRSQKKK